MCIVAVLGVYKKEGGGSSGSKRDSSSREKGRERESRRHRDIEREERSDRDSKCLERLRCYCSAVPSPGGDISPISFDRSQKASGNVQQSIFRSHNGGVTIFRLPEFQNSAFVYE